MRGATYITHVKGKSEGISIHAPRERSDLIAGNAEIYGNAFQSTLLVRGATVTLCYNIIMVRISIHAPRERSDLILMSLLLQSAISIHAPRERSDQDCVATIATIKTFQSTLLVRGATWLRQKYLETKKFQSTLLVRGATLGRYFMRHNNVISIHAPRERSDTIVF